jgi:hypothetical protein
MPRVGVEPTIPVFERPQTVCASDSAAIGTGVKYTYDLETAFQRKPPIKWVPVPLSLGLKPPGREADDSPLSKLRMQGATSPLPHVFMA